MAEHNQARKRRKNFGGVYTPDSMVNTILDLSGYLGSNILDKHIIDNSCGDGAFLTVIVRRLIAELKKSNASNDEITSKLSEFVHGIEIDKEQWKLCLDNLNNVASEFNLGDVNWDVRNTDSIKVHDYDNKMDFVVGNPPYVRVHNLGDKYSALKSGLFTGSGMTDLYIAFFEVGIRMLNNSGVLGYITPSSYFNSLAGGVMRQYFIDNCLLRTIVNLEHSQIFNATTYTAVTILDKRNSHRSIEYFTYDADSACTRLNGSIEYDDFFIGGKFYFVCDEQNNFISECLRFKSTGSPCCVKNGFATLADSIFISKSFDFKDLVRPIIKASTGEKKFCVFPYRDFGDLLSEEELASHEQAFEYLSGFRTKLESRSIEKNGTWYGFGRSQGVKDINKYKIAINTLIRDSSDIKLVECKPGCGVYSGLCILTEVPLEEIRSVLCEDNNFINYVRTLGKYKSGGYYTYSSRDLECFLNYSLSRKAKRNE